jgi:methylmalonyl-CoA mutase N-terminal domain/subunit
MYKEDIIIEIDNAQAQYEEELRLALSKSGSQSEHKTLSGISVKPLYTPKDVAEIDFLKEVSFPGHYPYTRGVFTAGFFSRGLNIRQVTGLGTAEETNTRWKYFLSHGASALSFVRDDGGGSRYDSNDQRVRGLIGHGGVALDTLYDYETLFEGIDITKYPVHMITASAYSLACYLIIAERRGIDFKKLRGSMSNLLRPENECLDIMEYCTRNVPLFNAGYLDMRNVREGGCTAAQEIAFGTAIAMAGSDVLIERGLEIDDFLHRITWFVNAGPELFEEVAKFRAIRKIWAKIFRERYGAKNENGLLARMHCQTYAPTLTKQQPFNNLMRSTIYALAAILGGVQSLHVNSFDEALAIPTEFSALLSIRTQQIIDLETGITNVIDPLGGSYYVEALTAKLESAAMDIIDDIQSRGGGFKQWDWMCDEVRIAAIENQKMYDTGEKKLVGVNTLVDENDIQMNALRILSEHADFKGLYEYDPSAVERQIKRLNKVLMERDSRKLEQAMDELLNVMTSGDNMVDPLIKAVKYGMTHGEFAKLKGKAYNHTPQGPYACNPPMVLA